MRTVLFLLLLVEVNGFAQSAMVDHEVYLLQFIGGGQPLTDAERSVVVQMIAGQMRLHPKEWMEVDQSEQKAIATIQAAGPAERAAFWDTNRYQYAFPLPSNSAYALNFGGVWKQEKSIIEAHDPALGIDPRRRLVFTAHMLPYLRQATEWAGGFYHVPGPDSNFETRVRSIMNSLSIAQVDVAFGLAHIVALQPLIRPEVAKAPPGFAQQVSQTSYQLNFADKKTPESEQMQLIVTTGAAAVRWGLHHGAATARTGTGVGQALYM